MNIYIKRTIAETYGDKCQGGYAYSAAEETLTVGYKISMITEDFDDYYDNDEGSMNFTSNS